MTPAQIAEAQKLAREWKPKDIGGILSREDKGAASTGQEVTVQQAADTFERGCIGASEAIAQGVDVSKVTVQEAIRTCLQGAADKVERDLTTAQVSVETRAKFEAVVREMRKRAITHK